MNTTKLNPIIKFLVLLFLFPFFAQAQFTSSNLPIVIINTNGQIIIDDEKITADMGVIYNGEGVRNYMTDPRNHYNGKIGIEIRGSSTQMFPKKGYAVETRDSTGENLNVQLLGMPSENDWVFNAEYNDKTLMRNVLVYDMARRTMKYASRSRYFELVLNGEYIGTYVLLEKIKNDKNRVYIKELDPEDITDDALTGGYIVKVDKLDGEDNGGWYSNYPPYPGATQSIYYQFHIPKASDIVPQQINYIKAFITNFESVMASPQYEDSLYGYPSIIDETSFADMFLISEVSRNVDAYRLSAYMYKDRDSRDRKLYAGPAWDFNHSLGNANYYDSWLGNGWQLDVLTGDTSFLYNDYFQVPFWWKKFKDSPRFKAKVKERWAILKNTAFDKNRIFGVIDSLVTYLNESQTRNFQKWPILGQWVWPNWYVGQTYQDEITYLKNWINGRLLWVNYAINLFTSTEDEKPVPEDILLISNYPNPFNPVTNVDYQIPGNGTANISVFSADGSLVSTLFSGEVTKGRYKVEFDAGNLRLASGFYPVVISYYPENGVMQKKTAKVIYLK